VPRSERAAPFAVIRAACAPRVGDERAYVSALVAARGPVASTIFGTGTSPGSVLVDAHARVPLGAGLAAVLALQNAFDVRDARDQNLLPLPGRLLFVSLEVHA
jgi:outer membrane receptor protein involved in Fe transport